MHDSSSCCAFRLRQAAPRTMVPLTLGSATIVGFAANGNWRPDSTIVIFTSYGAESMQPATGNWEAGKLWWTRLLAGPP
jgi:hypothetical protein